MLHNFTPMCDWDHDSEPLLFDEEFCQVLLKDLQMLPTPPQSPPTKTGFAAPLSKVDQLEFVSEFLLEDQDFPFNWDCDAIPDTGGSKDQQPQVSEDCLWRCSSEKSAEGKLSAVLSTSPLLSDIDTNIFEEIAGSTLECHDGALESQSLQGEDLLEERTEQRESLSDFSAMSTGSESCTSDSDEEIDVVTVKRCGTISRVQLAEDRRRQRALKRRHREIQQQHNYAAPCPASLRRAELGAQHKRGRAEPQRLLGARARSSAARQAVSVEVEDEEERRRTHNVMERQRRNELKNCFLRLRDNVPELTRNDKASKVVILKKAKDSIRDLELEGQRLAARKSQLRHKQEQLKMRLERLR